MRFLVPAVGASAVRGHHVLSLLFYSEIRICGALVLQQGAGHIHHVHQRVGQLALAAVLVAGGFLRCSGGAAQQGDGVLPGLVAGDALVQGSDLVVEGRALRLGVEVVVEGAAGGFAVEICFVVFRWFHRDTL